MMIETDKEDLRSKEGIIGQPGTLLARVGRHPGKGHESGAIGATIVEMEKDGTEIVIEMTVIMTDMTEIVIGTTDIVTERAEIEIGTEEADTETIEEMERGILQTQIGLPSREISQEGDRSLER